eukprot:GHVT01048815.1.p1 GENE.GHVT01048815.1~~GHVT01048815.1.p1  ORF type:complete len:647 (-),score=155.90 GHVT01048815.1:329-2269(-)
MDGKNTIQPKFSSPPCLWDFLFASSGLLPLATVLHGLGVELLATGGTRLALEKANIPVIEVSKYTGASEVFGGRVKTLHPKIHGGILFVRDNEAHESESASQEIPAIDMVVCNLYPFEKAAASLSSKSCQGGPSALADYFFCLENVDIGGPAMIRAAAKNPAGVAVVSSPDQYQMLTQELKSFKGATTPHLRRKLAAAAFNATAAYDCAIAQYLADYTPPPPETSKEEPADCLQETLVPMPQVLPRVYRPQVALKYGTNPHQIPAALCSLGGRGLPFEILSGRPGYINFLDAALAWQLVTELHAATGVAAAASFKHCSPAGAAIGRQLSDVECQVFGVSSEVSTAASEGSLALTRARGADPMSSFGDFTALSVGVDEETAALLATEVSDGIVAPGFTAGALAILAAKKKGAFVVLQADSSWRPPAMEVREVFGLAFAQRRNFKTWTPEDFKNVQKNHVCAVSSSIPAAAVEDLLVATVSLKFMQSNSVAFARDGQLVGMGAGQQSRVDCVKLAARKTATFFLRQHPKVVNLPFVAGVKKTDKINAKVRFIEGDFTKQEWTHFIQNFTQAPELLSALEKEEFLGKLTGVALSSDAFFPFRDSIDHAAKVGVKFVAHPGGSIQDEAVTSAATDYGMLVAHTGSRLFLH